MTFNVVKESGKGFGICCHRQRANEEMDVDNRKITRPFLLVWGATERCLLAKM